MLMSAFGLEALELVPWLIEELIGIRPCPRDRGKANKLEERWVQDAVFVGVLDKSDEVVCLTREGALKFRSIKRKQPTLRFDAELLKAVKGVPWNAQPDGSQTDSIPVRFRERLGEIISPTRCSIARF